MGEKERGLLYPIRVDGTESLPFMIKKDRVIFGRADHCDIRIYVDGVAPKHCLIAFNNDGKGFIVPLHKRGMTYINGALLRKRKCLTHNDVITIVKRSFRFHNSAEINSETPPSTPQCDKEVSDIFSFHSDGAVKKKRKLKRRVTFGPRLSPEEFDKNMPPATPLRRGSLPNKDMLSSPVIKYKTRRNSGTPEITESLTLSKRSRNEKPDQPNKKIRLSSPRRSSMERIEEDSESLDNDISSLEIIPKSQLAAARSISSCLPPFPVSSDESVLNVYVETVQKLALSVSMMSAFNMYNKILNDVSSITSGLPSTSKDTRCDRNMHFLQNKDQLSMSNFQNFVQTVFSTPFNNNQSNILPSCENVSSRPAKNSNSMWLDENNCSQNSSKGGGRSSFNKGYTPSNKTATVGNISELNHQNTSNDVSEEYSSIQDAYEDEYSDDDVFQDDSNDTFANDSRKSFSGFSMKQKSMHLVRKSLPAKYVKRKMTSSRKSGRMSGKIISVHSNYKYLRSKRISKVNKKQKRVSVIMKKYVNIEPKDIKMNLVEDKGDSDFIDIDEDEKAVNSNSAPLKSKESSVNFKRVTRAASGVKNIKNCYESIKSINAKIKRKSHALSKQRGRKIASKPRKSLTMKSKIQKQSDEVIKVKRGRKPRITIVDDSKNEPFVTITANEERSKSTRSGLKNTTDKTVAKGGRKPKKKNNKIELPEIDQSLNSNVEVKNAKRGRKPQNKVFKSPVKETPIVKLNHDSCVDSSSVTFEKVKRGRKPRKVDDSISVKDANRGRKPQKSSDYKPKVLKLPIAKSNNDNHVDSNSVLFEKVKRGRKARKIDDSILVKDVPKVKRRRKTQKSPDSKPKVLNDLNTPQSSVKRGKRGRKPSNLSKIFNELDTPKEKRTRKRRDSNSAVEDSKVKRGTKASKSDASKSEVVKEKKGRKNQSGEKGSTIELLPNQSGLEMEQKTVKRGRPKKKNSNATPEQKVVKRRRKPQSRKSANLNVSKEKNAVTASPKMKLKSRKRELTASPQKNTPAKVIRRKRAI